MKFLLFLFFPLAFLDNKKSEPFIKINQNYINSLEGADDNVNEEFSLLLLTKKDLTF